MNRQDRIDSLLDLAGNEDDPVEAARLNYEAAQLEAAPLKSSGAESTQDRLDLVETAWYEVTKGDLDLSEDTAACAIILAMWAQVEEYTGTVDIDTEDIDVRGDRAIAHRIAVALSSLWFGWPVRP